MKLCWDKGKRSSVVVGLKNETIKKFLFAGDRSLGTLFKRYWGRYHKQRNMKQMRIECMSGCQQIGI